MHPRELNAVPAEEFPFALQEPKGVFFYARRLVRLPMYAIQGVRPSRFGTMLITDRGAFQLVEDYQSVARTIAQGADMQAPEEEEAPYANRQ